MSEWQPIETAPKDETVVRLYIPGRPDLEGMTGRWNKLSGEWEAHPMTMTLRKPIEVPDPTYWMPLPSPRGRAPWVIVERSNRAAVA